MDKEVIKQELPPQEKPVRVDLKQLDIEFDGDGKIGFHKNETDHP